MALQKYEEYYNMNQTNRVALAKNATAWNSMLVKFKTDFWRLMVYFD